MMRHPFTSPMLIHHLSPWRRQYTATIVARSPKKMMTSVKVNQSEKHGATHGYKMVTFSEIHWSISDETLFLATWKWYKCFLINKKNLECQGAVRWRIWHPKSKFYPQKFNEILWTCRNVNQKTGRRRKISAQKITPKAAVRWCAAHGCLVYIDLWVYHPPNRTGKL